MKARVKKFRITNVLATSSKGCRYLAVCSVSYLTWAGGGVGGFTVRARMMRASPEV